MIVENLTRVFIFLIGSCIGSFLNVCIYRLPKEKSIVMPNSFCPKCKTPINWFDNIPILSWFILRGKCRKCSEKFSFRYPLVELLTAIIFLLLYLKFSLTLDFFKFGFFFSLLVVVSLIDIDYYAIPAYLCFIGIAVGLIFSLYETIAFIKGGFYGFKVPLPIVVAFKNLIFGLGFTYLFKFFADMGLSVYLSIRKKDSIEGETEALGLGDVDYMGMAAIFLGSKFLVLSTFFIAPFVAIIYSIYALIFKKSHLIPYLPYLSIATVISFLWGNDILKMLNIL